MADEEEEGVMMKYVHTEDRGPKCGHKFQSHFDFGRRRLGHIENGFWG